MVTYERLNVMCTMKNSHVLPGIRTYSLRPRGHQYSRHWQHYGCRRDSIKLCKTLQLGEPDNNNYMVLGRGPHLTHHENVRVCLLSDLVTTRELHPRQRHRRPAGQLLCHSAQYLPYWPFLLSACWTQRTRTTDFKQNPFLLCTPSNPGGGEIFSTRPDRSTGPPSLLYNGYLGFLRGKAAGAWRWPPIPSSVEVKERVELYLYSTSGPSWPATGRTLPLPLLNLILILYLQRHVSAYKTSSYRNLIPTSLQPRCLDVLYFTVRSSYNEKKMMMTAWNCMSWYLSTKLHGVTSH
jgi:hypothetical protein